MKGSGNLAGPDFEDIIGLTGMNNKGLGILAGPDYKVIIGLIGMNNKEPDLKDIIGL